MKIVSKRFLQSFFSLAIIAILVNNFDVNKIISQVSSSKNINNPKFSIKSVESGCWPLVIIGSGPAGLGAATYAGQAAIKTLVIEGKMPGGYPTKAGTIYNYPSYKEIEGHEIYTKIKAQAESKNIEFKSGHVAKVNLSYRPFIISLKDNSEIQASAIIISTGSKPVKTGVPGEKEYFGKGVAYCANCDGPMFKDKHIAVIGGGYGALRETGQLTKFAKQITLVNPNKNLRGPEMLIARAKSPKVTIKNNYKLKEIAGNGVKITGIKVSSSNGDSKGTSSIPVDGVFIALGQRPNTNLFKDKLKLNSKNEIVITNCKTQGTSIEGVFAAGDVSDRSQHQIITGVGEGYRAALSAEKYLKSINALKTCI